MAIRGNLGKVALTVNGAHDSTQSYDKLSVVSANGISYVSRKEVPAGRQLNEVEYWMPLTDDSAAAGAAAAAAINANNALQIIADLFHEDKNYSTGDYVVYSGVLYRYITSHTAGEWDGDEVEAITFSDEVKNVVSNGVSVAPIYLGDYICSLERYLPSCCVKVGTMLYAVDAPANQYAIDHDTNIGRVQIINLATNKIVSSEDIEVGHANSMTYCPDNEKFYINPGGEVISGVRVPTKFIYEYDSTFANKSKITIPDSMAMSVTYDYVKEKLYVLTLNSEDSNNICRLYEYKDNEFIFVGSYDRRDYEANPGDGRTSYTQYNQDIAIYNDKIYLSSPSGNCLIGDVPKNNGTNITFDKSFEILRHDNRVRWILGETEGWEFDESGHLICINYANIMNNFRQAYLLEIPTTTAKPYFTNSDSFAIGGSVEITDDSVDNFYLAPSEIRSVNQLSSLVNSEKYIVVHIRVTEDYSEIENIYIRQRTKLMFHSGNYICNRVVVDGGELVLETDNADAILTCNQTVGPVFECRHGSKLSFIGSIGLKISAPNLTNTSSNFISVSTNSTIIGIRVVPVNTGSIPWHMAGMNDVTNGLYYGSINITHVPTVISYEVNSTFPAIITGGSKSILFFVPEERAWPSGSMQITAGSVCFRGPTGYIASSESDSTYDLTDTTTYSVTVSKYSKQIMIRFNKKDDTAFTNAYNNVPLTGTVKTTLTISKV